MNGIAVFGRWFAVVLAFFLASCDNPYDTSSPDTPQLIVAIPSLQPAIAARAALAVAPTYIESIAVAVLDESENLIGSGIIPISGGQMKFKVPVGVALVVRGAARDKNGDNRFEGETQVPPLRPGGKAGVTLALDPLEPLGVATSGTFDPNAVAVAENISFVVTVPTNAKSDQPVTYRISGGVDQALFTINTTTGDLAFVTPPSYFDPQDSDKNNIYEVQVAITDGFEEVTQDLHISVFQVGPPPIIKHSIGGTVTGIGTGTLVIQNNGSENLTINADGSFKFLTDIEEGKTYNVVTLQQPSAPSRNCTVAGGSGTVAGVDVTNITIKCASALSPVTPKVVTGDSHTCALSAAGEVSCWGDNYYGQLGDGQALPGADSALPVRMNLANVLNLAAGYNHNCAVLPKGTVYCWGENTLGQLGDGTSTSSSTPVNVAGLSNITSVAAGFDHTCALLASGTVKCWGSNVYGQLGDNGTVSTSGTPVDVVNLTGGVAISADGNTTCVVKNDGTIACWGENGIGQLGNGDNVDSPIPVAVSNISDAIKVSVGITHTCALSKSGAVSCWGDNFYGQLGDETVSDSNVPIPVKSLAEPVVALSAGGGYDGEGTEYGATCVVTNSNATLCWGSNSNSQLGDETTVDSVKPVTVKNVVGANDVQVGGGQACVVTKSGAIQCWGYNGSGAVGNGGTGFFSIPVALPNSANTARVTAGNNYSPHACSISSAGLVSCWGYNYYGQLGTGDNVSTDSPVVVKGISGVTQVSAGSYHTCARTSASEIWCWGYNGNGQLGNGTNTNSNVPVKISNPSGALFTAVEAGNNHTCAISTGGVVSCWGLNSSGQLGNGGTTSSNTPYSLTSVPAVTSLSLRGSHTCALTTVGGVYCWGDNFYGQIGKGNSGVGTNALNPTAVKLSNITAIATGSYHSCARVNTGAVQCWGYNGYGSLGDGTNTTANLPVPVSGLTNAASVFAGGYSTCSTTNTGTVVCWGNNDYGQLGNGSLVNANVPTGVLELTSVTGVAVGYNTTCATTKGGPAYCWGNNYSGSVGIGIGADVSIANFVRGAPEQGILDVYSRSAPSTSAGLDHTCATTLVGGVNCWGANASGQLGNNTTTNSSVPVAVSISGRGQFTILQVASGDSHSCALTSYGGVICWGGNKDGQLGNGSNTDSLIPVAVSGLNSNVIAITAGGDHTCALNRVGAVKCWGNNQYGQLGNGGVASSNVPVNVTNLGFGISALAGGYRHTCATTWQGEMKCWGANYDGQLGNGTAVDSTTPVTVSGLTFGVSEMVARGSHTCAVITDGGIRCWGYNGNGQLGTGNTTSFTSPQSVVGLTVPAIAVAAGGDHTCAALSDGSARCWGANGNGQLGTGSLGSLTPLPVVNLGPDVFSVTARGSHTCALNRSGAIQCWGENAEGELGNGSTTNAPTPTYVIGFGG